MENQHPLDATPESAEAVTTEAMPGQAHAAPAASEQGKARHPRLLVARLAEVYPAAFALDGRKVRPLAVGILKELQAARAEEGGHGLSMQELRRALRYYTQGAAYHRAVARGGARVNLAGEAVGEVSAEQKAHAEARLAELAPKLAKRAARAPAEGKEGRGDMPPAERPRRLRKPSGTRGEARSEGKGGARKDEIRQVRAERPARNRKAPDAAVLSTEEKLDLLLKKFASK